MSAMNVEAERIMDSFPPFKERVDAKTSFTSEALDTMQVNLGRLCNLSCKHCHVDAGPNRKEVMTWETMEHCLKAFASQGFKTLDITGGSPEMNPHFERFLKQAALQGMDIMLRSNLVILGKKEYQHLPELYAELGITLIASLPHYTQKSVEKQRGEGSYHTLITMLKHLNDRGYGKDERLVLNLVFNPGGAFLPPDQAALEREYKQKLNESHGIVFDNLFAITNNPLGRFGNFLHQSGNLEAYMNRLIAAFNPETLTSMMCRNQISVGWDGVLYDCDFNQAAGISCVDGRSIADLATDTSRALRREVQFGNHCYACCAGSGSSCGGATA